MKNLRLVKSIVVLRGPTGDPLGALVVSHAEGRDPVVQMKQALTRSPLANGRAEGQGDGAQLDEHEWMRRIIDADWSAHEMYVQPLDHWGVLSLVSAN